MVAEKAKDDAKGSKLYDQREKPATLNEEDGGSTKQQPQVQIVHLREKPKQVKTDAPKSGKESLLDLLGAMKVEVTNKRKLKNLKVKQSYEPGPKSTPTVMESTTSMFQKAKVETSLQR